MTTNINPLSLKRSGYTLTQHGHSVTVSRPDGKITTVINRELSEETFAEIVLASERRETPERWG